MAATFRLHTQLTWPGLERPAPQDLAANLAARLRAEDFRQVIQDGPTVQYSKGPRASSRWNPLSYAPSGTVLISSTPEGFEFDCRLGSGRLVITIAFALVVGIIAGVVVGGSRSFYWFPLFWLLGVGGTASILLFLSAPSHLASMARGENGHTSR